jgi:hypothetical protein
MTTQASGSPHGGAGALHWYRRFPVATFLVVLTLAVITSPFEALFHGGDAVELARWTVVLLFGLLALSDSRRTLVLGIVLVVPALVGNWMHQLQPTLAPPWTALVPGLLFVGYVVMHLLRFIVRAARVDSEVLCAGVAGYLMLGLLWSLAYMLTGSLTPEAFHFAAGPVEGHVLKGFNAIYFSFITLATVGYGDIFPLSSAARVLAMMEGLAGTLYMAVLISRLVSLYASARQAGAGSDPNPR